MTARNEAHIAVLRSWLEDYEEAAPNFPTEVAAFRAAIQALTADRGEVFIAGYMQGALDHGAKHTDDEGNSLADEAEGMAIHMGYISADDTAAAPPPPAETPRASWDTKALDVARLFTHANEPQRRARLQCAVLDAMRWAAPAESAEGAMQGVDAYERAIRERMQRELTDSHMYHALQCVLVRGHELAALPPPPTGE